MLFTIVTDGGCSKNNGMQCEGAYAYLVFEGDDAEANHYITYDAVKIQNTTNNRMELSAAINGMLALISLANINHIDPNGIDLIVKTDSKYLRDGYHDYLPEWVENGWRKADGSAVKNQDLWKQFRTLSPDFKSVKFQWVKGHADDRWNIEADAMVNKCLYAKPRRTVATNVEERAMAQDDPALADILV